MKKRFKLYDVFPEGVKLITEMDQFVQSTGISKIHQELIRLRASQLNGCAYCMNMHAADAVKFGEDPKRLYVLSAWREAANWFSEEEQNILTLTEEVTLIGQHGIKDETYDQAIALFGEQKTAHIIFAVIAINAWNRFGVGLNMHP